MELEMVIENDIRGNVLVCQQNNIMIQKSYGYADLPNKMSNTYDTKFATASAGKVFVAVGILQLIEKGLLHFEDTIGDILDFDLKQIDGNITVEQLLNHTSGIPDYFDESVMDEYEELWTDFPNYKIRSNRDLLPLFIDKPMMYPRGSRFQYNNTGYVVLAIIIEIKTGMEFDKYLKKNIFEPCGMYNTDYYELDRLPAKCAVNYIYNNDDDLDDYRTNIFCVDAKGTGAGGAFTTVEDIRLFWECLMSHKLLSPTMTNNMLSEHASDEEEYYGYGIWLKKTESGYIPYFQGCDPGVSFISSYDVDKKLLIVLVSNHGDNVWRLLRKITDCIPSL
jgi:CubicO group peptidase (beta-lactamase class C family)